MKMFSRKAEKQRGWGKRFSRRDSPAEAQRRREGEEKRIRMVLIP
jgi:hypothetical protein